MVIGNGKIELSRPGLLVLAGCSGAGKSTLAQVHFPEDWVVSSDRCRWMICGDEADQTVTRQAFRLLDYIVGMRLEQGKSTVVDSTALLARDRKGLLQMALGHRMPVWLMMVWADEEQCLAAQHSRERQVPPSAVQMMFERSLQTRDDILSGRVLDEGFHGAALLDRNGNLLGGC